jgi:hypothetical protein
MLLLVTPRRRPYAPSTRAHFSLLLFYYTRSLESLASTTSDLRWACVFVSTCASHNRCTLRSHTPGNVPARIQAGSNDGTAIKLTGARHETKTTSRRGSGCRCALQAVQAGLRLAALLYLRGWLAPYMYGMVHDIYDCARWPRRCFAMHEVPVQWQEWVEHPMTSHEKCICGADRQAARNLREDAKTQNEQKYIEEPKSCPYHTHSLSPRA